MSGSASHPRVLVDSVWSAEGVGRDLTLVIGGDVLSKILDWEDRSTLVLFGDGAGAVVMEHVEEGGFLGFELGADGGGVLQRRIGRPGPRGRRRAAR